MKFSAQYLVFPAPFHVISRKINYIWDRVHHYPNVQNTLKIMLIFLSFFPCLNVHIVYSPLNRTIIEKLTTPCDTLSNSIFPAK